MSIMLISRKGNTIMKLKMKLVVGLLAGIICGLFGTGGGMLLVPYFIYILKIDEKEARATSLFVC